MRAAAGLSYNYTRYRFADAVYYTTGVGFGGQWGYYTDYPSLAQQSAGGAAATAGQILLGLRYYDPQQGRFYTRDPIGYEGGINLYAYCGNNPIMGIDPSGTDWIIGPANNPYLVFTWGGTKRGLKTGAAVLADTFSGGAYSSKAYKNEPGYDASAWSAWVGREAILTIATAGLSKVKVVANVAERIKIAKVLKGPLSLFKPSQFRCVDTASATAQALTKAGIPFRRIIIEDAQKTLSAATRDGVQVFTKTGYHEAVLVKGRIYDLITGAKGLALNDWIKRLGLTTGKIIYHDFVETAPFR